MSALNEPKTADACRYLEAGNHGLEFLMGQLRPDGGFGPEERGVTDYYKVISVLNVCGETLHANRLCKWIRENGITPEGDFGPRPADAFQYSHAYYNSWGVGGARRMGQYDLAMRGFDFLMDFHDPESGGFYSSPTERSASTLQDIWVVCGCARAALTVGRIDVAEGVGRWLEEVFRQQPNFPEQIFGVYSRERGLIIDPDPADEIRYVCNRDAQEDQFFFNPGISVGVLARLYLATGKPKWLDLAMNFPSMVDDAPDYLFRSLRAGKDSWAASNLYTVTGLEKYRDITIKVANNLVDRQTEKGSWDSVIGENDATAELTYCLDQIYQSLGADSA